MARKTEITSFEIFQSRVEWRVNMILSSRLEESDDENFSATFNVAINNYSNPPEEIKKEAFAILKKIFLEVAEEIKNQKNLESLYIHR